MAKKVAKTTSISGVIKRRRYNLLVKGDYISLISRVVILLLIGYLLCTHVVMLMRNTGMGMFPALQDGDLLLAYRLEENYAKEDAVIYKVDGKLTTGRIIAREGDYVNMDENGTLYVNGTAQSGEIMYPTYAKEGLEYPYCVPEGMVFILGDYRTQAYDSREHGPIPLSDVEGKILTLLRRKGI